MSWIIRVLMNCWTGSYVEIASLAGMSSWVNCF